MIIENILGRINDVLVKYRLRNKTITRECFIRTYNRPDDYDMFFDFAKEYQKKFSRVNELETMQVHSTVISKIQDYAPSLHFDDITRDWLDEYYFHLRKELNNCENTAYKNMSTFRKYARAAWRAGYMDEYPFEEWSIKRTTASYTYLTKTELTVLINTYRNGDLEAKFHKTLEFFPVFVFFFPAYRRCKKIETGTVYKQQFYIFQTQKSEQEARTGCGTRFIGSPANPCVQA